MTANPIFYVRTKHIQVNCHFIREVDEAHTITLPYVSMDLQNVDIFIKALPRNYHQLSQVVAQLVRNVGMCMRVREFVSPKKRPLLSDDSGIVGGKRGGWDTNLTLTTFKTHSHSFTLDSPSIYHCTKHRPLSYPPM